MAKAAPYKPNIGIKIEFKMIFIIIFKLINILWMPGEPAWMKIKSNGIRNEYIKSPPHNIINSNIWHKRKKKKEETNTKSNNEGRLSVTI